MPVLIGKFDISSTIKKTTLQKKWNFIMPGERHQIVGCWREILKAGNWLFNNEKKKNQSGMGAMVVDCRIEILFPFFVSVFPLWWSSLHMYKLLNFEWCSKRRQCGWNKGRCWKLDYMFSEGNIIQMANNLNNIKLLIRQVIWLQKHCWFFVKTQRQSEG